MITKSQKHLQNFPIVFHLFIFFKAWRCWGCDPVHVSPVLLGYPVWQNKDREENRLSYGWLRQHSPLAACVPSVQLVNWAEMM